MNRNDLKNGAITFQQHKEEVSKRQLVVGELRGKWAAAVHKHNELSQTVAVKPDDFNKALQAKAAAELEEVVTTYRLARELLRRATEQMRMFNMRGKSLNARGQLVRL